MSGLDSRIVALSGVRCQQWRSPKPFARLKRRSRVWSDSADGRVAQYGLGDLASNRDVDGYGRRIRLIAEVAASVTA